MPARNYGTGPCFIYVKPPGEPSAGSAPVRYLGVCRNWPTISNVPHWREIFSDSAGREMPQDIVYYGQGAVVSCLMTEYDDAVVQTLRDYVSTQGFDDAQSRGRFLWAENRFTELWVRWPHSNPAAGNVLIREPGRHYPYTFVQVDDIPEMGTSPMAIQLTFRCVAIRQNPLVIQQPLFHRFGEEPPGGRAAREGRMLNINLFRAPLGWLLWDLQGFASLPPPTRQVA